MSEEENNDEDEGSEEEYTCEICGQTFDSQRALWGHKPKHTAETDENKKTDSSMAGDDDGRRHSTDIPPSPEQQMLNEMAEVLKDEIAMAPGGSEDKAKYIVHKFSNNSIYREDDLKLYNLITNVVPKMNNDLINDIVDSVIKIREDYNKGDGGRSRSPRSYGTEGGGRTSSYYKGKESMPHTRERRRPTGRGDEPTKQEDIQKKIEEKAQELFEKKIEEKRREDKMENLERQIANMGEKIETLAREGFKKQEEEEKDSEIKRLEKQIQKTNDMVQEAFKKQEEEEKDSKIERLEKQIQKTNNRMMQMMKEDKDDTDEFEKLLKFIRLTEEFTSDDDKNDVEDVLQEHGVVTRGDLEKMQKDQTIQKLNNELQEMKEYIQRSGQQSGDFNSDDAKIIAQGLSQVGRKMDQGHETVKHVIQNLPQILNSGEGQQANLGDKELEQIENELNKIEQEEQQTVQPTQTPTARKTPEVDVSGVPGVGEGEVKEQPPEQAETEPEMEEPEEGGETPPHDEEPLLEKELDESEVEEE